MAYEDLLKDTSQYVETGDYFLLTITDLDINTPYPIQFRWKKKDGTFGVWSSAKTIVTPGESFPNVPSALTVTGGAGILTVTWDGKDSLGNTFINFDRLDIYIDGSPFDGTKATTSFFTAGTKTISAPAGTYTVAAYAISKAGTKSAINTPITKIVTEVGEIIQAPVAPSSGGFSSTRVLSGVTVSWNGTYSSAWTGFQAINIYAGTSATLTGGTYIKVGQMTANKISNTITIPVDGTYVRYDLPVYIHASSVNKDGTESSIVANVTSQSTGARSAVGSDLADTIISNAKLVNDAVTAVKIATNAITTTKIADDAITTAKLVANAVTADKITSSAITSDKIAANAITAGKILAGEITVSKLAAGTLSVNNLEAGNISATSYIRAGSGNTGARVEMSSSAISGGPAAGFYIYNSAGTAVLSAPLSGGLSIVGDGTFTGNLSIGSSNTIFKAEPTTGIWLGNSSYTDAPFRVSTNGVLKANSGSIAGWNLDANYFYGTNFQINSADSTIYVGPTGGQHIRISSTELAHYNNGTPTNKFTLTTSNGNLTIGGTITASSASLSGYLSAGNARFGTDVSGTNDGIYINANNYWYDGGNFSVGNASKNLTWDGATLNVTGDISGSTITGSTFYTAASGSRITINETSNTIKIYPDSTLNPGSIGPTIYLGTGSLRIASPYATGYAQPVITMYSLGSSTAYIQIDADLTLFSSGISLGGGMYAPSGTTTVNKLEVNSTLNANTLGTTSSNGQGAIYQDSNGYLKVRTGTGSSIKIKDNVAPFESVSNYSNIINNMNLVTFNYKPEVVEDPWFNQLGMIVEDLVQHTDSEFLIEYKNNEPSGIYYEKIPLFLVGAFKEMTQKIEEMQSRLDALEG